MKLVSSRLFVPLLAMLTGAGAIPFCFNGTPGSLHAAEEQPNPEVATTPIPAFRVIRLEEFQGMQASKQCVILDARSEKDYAAGHVPGAVSLPRYKVVTEFPAVESRFPKNQLLVIYCGNLHCESSDLEAKDLIAHGYTRLAVFKGGMQEWRDHHLAEEK